MIRKTITKTEFENENWKAWNLFIEILAMSEYSQLSQVQRVAADAFWYESEVQNGGHLQYFENQDRESYSQVIESLKTLGAMEYSSLLEKASTQHFSKKRRKISSIFSYIKRERQGEYDTFDDEYHDVNPDMNHFLKKYLNENLEDFLEIVK